MGERAGAFRVRPLPYMATSIYVPGMSASSSCTLRTASSSAGRNESATCHTRPPFTLRSRLTADCHNQNDGVTSERWCHVVGRDAEWRASHASGCQACRCHMRKGAGNQAACMPFLISSRVHAAERVLVPYKEGGLHALAGLTPRACCGARADACPLISGKHRLMVRR